MKTTKSQEIVALPKGRVAILASLIIASAVAGAAWLAFLLATAADRSETALAASGLFACWVLAAGLYLLPVGPRVKASVTTAPLFAAALLLEPGNAALAAVTGSLAYQILGRWMPGGYRFPWFKYPFNAGQAALSVGTASLVFHSMGGEVPGPVLPAAVAAVVMYAINTGLVSTAASIHEGRALPRMWWEGTLSNGPAEAGLFAFGLLGALAFASDPVLAVVVVGVPVAVLYLAFSRLASANAQLEQAMVDLKEAEGRMVSNSKLATVGALSLDLAHQVRNPLFIVLARLERIRNRLGTEHPMHADTEKALDAANRIQQLTDNLVAMARQQLVPIDVATVVEDAVGMAVPANQPRVSAVERSVPADLPKIQGNPVLLREVLSNLVANALEASAPGVPVAVTAAARNGGVVIEVEDHGVGIPQERLARMFEPFQTSKSTGLGLGLFSAKHILGMHGGSLEIQSREGKGTVVTVRLPASLPTA